MKNNPHFEALTPPLILSSIEGLYGLRLEGIIKPLNSYINRVFEVKDEEGLSYIAKFYRPGRWSPEALEEEHDLLFECAEAELPVVEPLLSLEGYSLEEAEDDETGQIFNFALFPKKAGRNFDAETEDDWLRMGRLLGRLHSIASAHPCQHRDALSPALARKHLQRLEEEGVIHKEVADTFISLCRQGLDLCEKQWIQFPLQRIHGDCHRGNILDRSLEGLLLFDFDDMMMGPPVQDLWLLLPGRREECGREIALITEGYEEMKSFDPRAWNLVEPLRFLRMLHFLAWTAIQRKDTGFEKTFPDWGSRAFWIKEVEDFKDQMRAMEGR